MGLPIDLGVLKNLVAPEMGDIGKLFGQFGKLPTEELQQALSLLDDETLQKVADWSYAFTQKLNDLGEVDAKKARQIIEPNISDDFMEVMKGTQYEGVLITPEQLGIANNAITKAIKAKNWIDAIQVGSALAGALPL